MIEPYDTGSFLTQTDRLWAAWINSGCQCTGTTTAGKRCRARCKRNDDPSAFFPGVTDRCPHHVDGLDLRTRIIARIAWQRGADDIESSHVIERIELMEQIRLAEQARLAAAKQAAAPPIEPTSHRGNGATGRYVQSTFKFASLADRLEHPPRLEPGPRPPLSHAVEVQQGESN